MEEDKWAEGTVLYGGAGLGYTSGGRSMNFVGLCKYIPVKKSYLKKKKK